MRRSDLSIFGISILPVIVIALCLLLLKSMVAAFVLYHIVICLILPALYLEFYPRKGQKLVELLGLRRGRVGKSIIVGLVVGVLFFVTIILFFQFFGNVFLSGEHITTRLTGWGYDKNLLVWLALYFIFFNAVVEEIFWRGFLFSYYRNLFGEYHGSVLLSFCFIQYHFITIWLLFSFATAVFFTPFLFFTSFFWCYLRIKYNNIYAPIISHLFADLAIMFVYYTLVI